jgi:hypothetical protein
MSNRNRSPSNSSNNWRYEADVLVFATVVAALELVAPSCAVAKGAPTPYHVQESITPLSSAAPVVHPGQVPKNPAVTAMQRPPGNGNLEYLNFGVCGCAFIAFAAEEGVA